MGRSGNGLGRFLLCYYTSSLSFSILFLSYMLSSIELTPFLHKLLLLRDVIREDYGLPGGLHDSSRPDAYNDTEENIRGLFTYRTGSPNSTNGTDLVPVPPLVMAAQRGNVEAIHLLLLFGEGIHNRRKGNERALGIAVEQGNILAVAALLGRLPLRPPKHPDHIAKRLGLIRPMYNVYGPGYTYSPGVRQGPLNVSAAIAAAKVRAELASAQGISTGAGTTKASATAAAALTGGTNASQNSNIGGTSISNTSKALTNINLGMTISSVEAQIAQTEAFENDGRYRAWCHGYHMGSFWATYDTSLAAWENLYGYIGAEADIASVNSVLAAQNNGVLTTVPKRKGKGKIELPPITVNLQNLSQRLNAGIAPGSCPFGPTATNQGSITAAYAAQALLTSRLPPSFILSIASRVRPRNHVHVRLPEPFNYGVLAADAIAVKVRLNVGPVEGRTPLHIAAERGRVEIGYLLLSHFNPSFSLTGDVPDLPKKIEDNSPPPIPGNVPNGPNGGGGGNPGAPQPPPPGLPNPAHPNAPNLAVNGNNGAAVPGNAPAANNPPVVVIPPSVLAARAALSAIASQAAYALSVPIEVLNTSLTPRKEELLSELLGEQRDRAEVDAAPNGAHTPLCLACERGDDRFAALLLHWGADVNRPGKKEARPILVAAMAGHEHLLRLLLRSSCEIDAARAVAAAIREIQERKDALQNISSNGRNYSSSLNDFVESDNDNSDNEDILGTTPRERMQIFNKLKSGLSFLSTGPSITSSNTVFNLLGLQNVTNAMLKGTSNVGGGKKKKSQRTGILSLDGAKSTAATNAMGSTVAAQSGRRKAKGESRRPEEPSIDTCEPTVITALATAASQTGGTDEWGQPIPPRPAPYDPVELYLPPEEALIGVKVSGPSALSYYKMGGHLSGTKKIGAGAGGGRLAALLASGAVSLNSSKTNPSLANVVSTVMNSDADNDSMAAEILSVPTAAGYTILVAQIEEYRTVLKAQVFTILRKSRIASGIGSLPDRPSLEIDIGDESGYSALFIMACAGKLDSVQLLCAAGADCTLATKRGKTPIYGAVEKQHNDVVEFLMPKYSASQLRANTTYGTNVLHAANKAGNSRIRDMLQAYCVDYDSRMARAIKAEAQARRKAMWGDSEEVGTGGAIAEGSEAANHLARLRRLAEAARKKQEDKSWAMLHRHENGGNTNDDDNDDEGDNNNDENDNSNTTNGIRGRSVTRKDVGSLSPYRSNSKSVAPKATSKAPTVKPAKTSNEESSSGTLRGRSLVRASSGNSNGSDSRGSSRGTSVASDDNSVPTNGASSDFADSEAENDSKSNRRRISGQSSSKMPKETRGILLSRLAAVAAAATNKAKEEKTEKITKSLGTIPASVYAAAAVSTTNPATSSPKPQPLSPYARRLDGTVSPAAAALLSKTTTTTSPLSYNNNDNRIGSSDSISTLHHSPMGSENTIGTNTTSSPLSTHLASTTTTSTLISKTTKGAHNGVNISPRPNLGVSVINLAAGLDGNDVNNNGTKNGTNDSTVFDRLAQRAKEMEQKRKHQEEEMSKKKTTNLSAQAMAAALVGGLPPKTNPKQSATINGTSTSRNMNNNGNRRFSNDGGLSGNESDQGYANNNNRHESDGGSSIGSGPSSPSRLTSKALDTSMDRMNKYGNTGAELRANARAEIIANDNDIRAKRAAHFEKLLRTANSLEETNTKENNTTNISRDVSPIRSPARNRHDLDPMVSTNNWVNDNNNHQQHHSSSSSQTKPSTSHSDSSEDISAMLANIDARMAKQQDKGVSKGPRNVHSANVRTTSPPPNTDRENISHTYSPGAQSEPGSGLRRGFSASNDNGKDTESINSRPPLRPRQGFVEVTNSSLPANIDADSPLARVLNEAGISPRSGGGNNNGSMNKMKKTAIFGAALNSAPVPSLYNSFANNGLIPTASGSTFVPARTALTLNKNSIGDFSFPGENNNYNNNDFDGEKQAQLLKNAKAREERNRERDQQKLERIRRAKEEAKAKELELLPTGTPVVTSSVTLKLAAAAYGNPLATKKKKSNNVF